MEDFFGKKYEMTHEENYEEFLSYLGVNYMRKRIALALTLVECLTRNDDGTYTLNVSSTLFDSNVVFTPGVEFDQKKPDGNMVKATITIDGNKLTHTQIVSARKIATHVSEFFEDKIIKTTTATGFDKVVTRIYTLVE